MKRGFKPSTSYRSKKADAKTAPARPVRHKGVFLKVSTSLPLLLLVALLLRIGFAWDYVRQNSRQALGVLPFLQESGNIAASLAAGHGFSSPFRVDTGPTAWMPPVYPWLLSEIFRVFGVRTYDSFLAAVTLNIICSAFTCIPIYFAGRRVGGHGVAAGAAWLWALFPNTILNTFQSMWDASLGALLAAMILWATLAIERSEDWRDWCAYGLLWGFALLTNATLLSLVPLILVWLVYRLRDFRGTPATPGVVKTAVAKPALAAAIALLCCAPWTIRNYSAFHRIIPLRSNLGLQLWIGNNENARESWREELHPIFNSAERARYIELGEIDYMREKRREAIQYMLSHPTREAALIGNRFVATWSGGTPTPVKDFVRTPGLWFRSVLLFNSFIALGAVAGIILLFKRRNSYLFPIAVFPIIFPCVYYLTLSYPRYRLPADPPVMLLTAVALDAFWRSRKTVAIPEDPIDESRRTVVSISIVRIRAKTYSCQPPPSTL
jgi:4-amino-4-deoxy-L-arabinose transferase-like glycosyltransferase